MKVGLLHTVPALAPVFDGYVRDALRVSVGDVDVVHLAQAELLTLALAGSPEVTPATRAACDALVGLGCTALMVTCSSIGEVAMAIAEDLPVPVIRVDGPMAQEAARVAAAAGEGSTVTVLATQPSTIGPSGRLVEQAVDQHPGAHLVVETVLVEGAAAALGAGDKAQHDALLRAAAQEAAGASAVIVLAQASMATSLDGVELGIPVITSPRTGAARLAEIAADQRQTQQNQHPAQGGQHS